MSTSKQVVDVYAAVMPLLGTTLDDAKLRAFLHSIGHWPLPEPEDVGDLHVEDPERGFTLVFEDGASLPSPALRQPAGTLVLCGCFFYADGVEEFEEYRGPLPRDITWSDTPVSLAGRLGASKNEFRDKRTGELDGQRWELEDQRLLTASYNGDVLEQLYLGIY